MMCDAVTEQRWDSSTRTLLFYMRARGIAEKEARLLLMFAFVNEVIDTVRLDALKDRLHLLVEKRFRGELNKMPRMCHLQITPDYDGYK